MKEIEDRHSVGVYPKRQIELVRGLGSRVWDADGKEYLDFAGSHGVCFVGHNHPKVVEAIRRQSGELLFCSPTYYTRARAKLVEKIASVAPAGLEKVFLSNSGTEAVEAGLKFARVATGRKKFVACFKSFHGRTMGALSLTWKKEYREPFEPLVAGVKHVCFGDAQALREAIDEETAAFVVEPVQGEGGVNVPPPEYLREAKEICEEKGALLVLDEVQTGFGRTGKMFACMHSGVAPDVLCVAKAMGGGFPIGAAVTTREVSEKIPMSSHGSTFGGAPLACAASLAAIEAIESEGLCKASAEKGAFFLEQLKAIESPQVVEARGKGLMLGLELKEKNAELLQQLAGDGVLALPAGPKVLRFLPPAVCSKGEIGEVVEKISGRIK